MKDEEDPYNCSTESETDDDNDNTEKDSPNLERELLYSSMHCSYGFMFCFVNLYAMCAKLGIILLVFVEFMGQHVSRVH